jgi:hypothetical protein
LRRLLWLKITPATVTAAIEAADARAITTGTTGKGSGTATVKVTVSDAPMLP